MLPEPERRRHLTIVWNVLREPMVLLLLAAASVYTVLGDPQEAGLMAVSVLLVIGLTVYQEQKSERALQALRDLATPRARVVRDGEVRLIGGAEVVVGDLILVEEGERVPADARVIEETDLHVDESMLTGESVPVARSAASGTAGAELLHASTLVVRGRGTAVVVATGVETAVGRIGAALRAIRIEPTPMQLEMRRLAGLFTLLSLASCALVTGLYFATRGGWLDALLAGITLAMANIPEEFPIVMTVFVALGAWRLAQHKVLVRRTPAIEALGAITVLCTDKTGTLTENRMAIAGLGVGDEYGDVDTRSAALESLLECAALASAPRSHDPMDRAVTEAAARARARAGRGEMGRHVREYPLSPRLPAVTHVWAQPDSSLVVACKGAPEAVAGLCKLPANQLDVVLARTNALAERGFRVLAVGTASWVGGATEDATALPATMQEFDFSWRGLVAFADPLRAAVPDAVAEAKAAGIRVIMLTGDHVQTARAIATQAGISRRGDVALGSEMDSLDEGQLSRRLAGVDVFARVRPEHKLQLVEMLKRDGQVVAMTGDGVNDAPALMAAHVGIAMGGRGTDVAREAASIVLLDDDFVSVIRGIGLGRAIYDNIGRAVRYILAVHVPITGLALLPLLTGGPLVLLPLHVVVLELIIDPACSFVFEREAPDPALMRRPPRPPTQRMLGARGVLAGLAQGAIVFAAVVAAYALGHVLGLPAPEVGALAFTTLVTGNLGLIVLFRSGSSLLETLRRRNPAFSIVAVSTLSMLVTVTRFEVPAAWFGFAPPPLASWVVAMALPLVCVALMYTRPARRLFAQEQPARA